jgi:hypothetical protein
MMRERTQKLDWNEQPCVHVVAEHRDGERRVTEDPSNYSATDAVHRKPRAVVHLGEAHETAGPRVLVVDDAVVLVAALDLAGNADHVLEGGLPRRVLQALRHRVERKARLDLDANTRKLCRSHGNS